MFVDNIFKELAPRPILSISCTGCMYNVTNYEPLFLEAFQWFFRVFQLFLTTKMKTAAWSWPIIIDVFFLFMPSWHKIRCCATSCPRPISSWEANRLKIFLEFRLNEASLLGLGEPYRIRSASQDEACLIVCGRPQRQKIASEDEAWLTLSSINILTKEKHI